MNNLSYVFGHFFRFCRAFEFYALKVKLPMGSADPFALVLKDLNIEILVLLRALMLVLNFNEKLIGRRQTHLLGELMNSGIGDLK